MSKRITLLTGPPGAGKGTQAKLVAENLGWQTFSVGAILRDTAPPEIKEIMNSGKLLPAAEVVKLVVGEIQVADRPVLVDGFPRRLDQAEAFDQHVHDLGIEPVKVLFLTIDKEESWHRLAQRGRKDDERETWQKRWIEYEEKTLSAVEYYRQKGQLIEVDGSGGIAEVQNMICEALNASKD